MASDMLTSVQKEFARCESARRSVLSNIKSLEDAIRTWQDVLHALEGINAN